MVVKRLCLVGLDGVAGCFLCLCMLHSVVLLVLAELNRGFVFVVGKASLVFVFHVCHARCVRVCVYHGVEVHECPVLACRLDSECGTFQLNPQLFAFFL